MEQKKRESLELTSKDGHVTITFKEGSLDRLIRLALQDGMKVNIEVTERVKNEAKD